MQRVVPRVACAVLVLGLAIAGVADAGVSPLWRELGGSASGGGVSQAAGPAAVRDGAVDVGPDGRPVVAYTEYPDPAAPQGAITVKRWTGSTWTTLSGAGGIGWGYAPQVRIAPSGAIHVAWLHDGAGGNTEVRLRVRAGTTFDELGGSDSPGGLSGANPGLAAPFSLALDGGGNPLVAFPGVVDNGVVGVTPTPALIDGTVQVYVRRWTGSAWEFVGSDFTGGGASNALSFESDGGDASFHGADSPALAVDGAGNPVVAFTYLTAVNGDPAASADIHVARWNGTTWEPVGPAGGVNDSPAGSRNPSLAADATGQLALAWEEDAPAGATSVWVRVWNGSAWRELAGSATGSGFTRSGTLNVLPQIALDPAGSPIVVWRTVTDPATPAQIFVLRWNGSDAWEEMGLDSATNAGISDARLDVGAPALALAPSGGSATAGVPTVAWLDVRDPGPGQIFLRRLDAGATTPLAVAASTVRLSVAVRTPVGTPRHGDVGTITVGTASGLVGTCGIDGTGCTADVVPGTQLVLTASPEAGNRFLRWSGGPCDDRTNATCQFTLNADRSTTAVFRAVTAVRVDKPGTGAGKVTGTGFSCGLDCVEEVFTGAKRTLTPAAATGSRFLGWSGDACDGQAGGDCTFAAAGVEQSIIATFELRKQQLTVANRTNGRIVNLAPLPDGTIDCGDGNDVCGAVLDFGTQVTLSATPVEGSRFVKWTGDVCNGLKKATCTFKIPARNVSVAAKFRNVTTVSLTKSGRGTIVSTPAGITCGLSCTSASFDFARGTLVRLTPTPAVGWTFDGFSGVCAGLSCPVDASTVSQLSVAANFSIQQRRLRVSVVGAGSVTGDGLACDTSTSPCEATYDYGTRVLLTPAAPPGHRFTGWSQACSGTGACSPLMTLNRSVTATFRPVFSLAVTKSGNSKGTITGPGIKCGTDCEQMYLGGKRVTLTRSAPITGTVFRWLDDCEPRGNRETCTLTMNADRRVGAEYKLRPLGLTVKTMGPGTVSGLVGGVTCGADRCFVVDYGTPVDLIATAATSPASEFVSWAGCKTVSDTSCSFTMKTKRTVTATFRPKLQSLALQTLSTGPLGVGGTRQLTAIATFTDGSQQNVTALATWSSSSKTVATVNTSGLVTARGLGNASITATFRTSPTSDPIVGDSVVVAVDTLLSIDVSCRPYGDPNGPVSGLACLPSGLNFEVHCRATGSFAGSPDIFDITEQVKWLSSATAVAASTGRVSFTGTVRQSFRIIGVGTAALFARQGSTRSRPTGSLGQAWVVQSKALKLIQAGGVPVPPQIEGPTSVSVNGQAQLRAMASFKSTAACPMPPPRDFSLLVQWTSSNDSVAEVNFFGRVRGVAQGSATITATYGKMSDTTTVVVNP